MFLRASLPETHMSQDSKDFVKLGTGLVATMSALVLGLLIASAKGSYDTQRNDLTQISSDVIVLDRILADYGSETTEARDLLRRSVARALDEMWPKSRARPKDLEPRAPSDAVLDKIDQLAPQNDAQRALKMQALTLSINLAHTRWLAAETGSSIPLPILVVLVFWLSIIFVSF